MVRDRRGPETPQRPPPWRPARNLDRDSRSFFNYRLALEPLGLSFAGSGPSGRVLPGSPAAAAAVAADPWAPNSAAGGSHCAAQAPAAAAAAARA